MNKEQKRKQQLKQRTLNESLEFQTLFGARKKLGVIPADIMVRLEEEMLVFSNMEVAEDLLALKSIIDELNLKFGFIAEPSKGTLAGSYVAYFLGIEPTNPAESGAELNPLDFTPPLFLTISYDNAVRNQAVEWMKAQGYEVTTYLGQPMLRMKHTRVLIKRVVKA